METKLGFVFPGQGSQSVGMGFGLATRFSDFESIFLETLREADASIGFPLSQILREGPAEKLKETDITQPALLTVSTAMSRWLKSKGITPHVALGHSLGEFSALVFSEALSFSQAVKLVHLRGRLMQEAVPSGVGGMAALLGATPEIAQNLCEKVKESLPGKVLEPSAYNCPGQVVLSGHIVAIDCAVARAKELGARAATKLEVSGPFHCSLLKNAGAELGKALSEIDITAPQTQVIANTTADIEHAASDIRKNLEDQVSQAVRWEESVKRALSLGVTRFVEVGSGKVLTGLLKKICPETPCESLDTIEDLKLLGA